MKFIKEEEEKREDYIFQKNTKTIFGAGFTLTVLIILIIGVAISAYYFEWL